MTSTDRASTYVPPRWIDTRDVAKLVRAFLKREHPGVKFSVRIDRYAGGSSVRVSAPYAWTHAQERELCLTLSSWSSSGFDGMTDSSYPKSHTLCPTHGVRLVYVGAHWGTDDVIADPCCADAEPVNLGASHVTVSREWQRPAGITRASDVRKGDVLPFGTVADVDRYRASGEGRVRIIYTDGMASEHDDDVILPRRETATV